MESLMKKLYTLGFTKKKASVFFGLLCNAEIQSVLDVRLNNVSQLAGFAKRDDLGFFLREICNCGYRHVDQFAPTQAILDAYKTGGSWYDYETSFRNLIATRKIENILQPEELDMACLLCSEATPEKCHRRLVAEYLRNIMGGIEIIHL